MSVDVVTFEFENVPAASLAFLARERPVRPGVRSLERTSDRITEKEFLRSVGVPVQPFANIANAADLDLALVVSGRDRDHTALYEHDLIYRRVRGDHHLAQLESRGFEVRLELRKILWTESAEEAVAQRGLLWLRHDTLRDLVV